MILLKQQILKKKYLIKINLSLFILSTIHIIIIYNIISINYILK